MVIAPLKSRSSPSRYMVPEKLPSALTVSEAMAEPERPVRRPRQAPANSRGSLKGMTGAAAQAVSTASRRAMAGASSARGINGGPPRPQRAARVIASSDPDSPARGAGAAGQGRGAEDDERRQHHRSPGGQPQIVGGDQAHGHRK